MFSRNQFVSLLQQRSAQEYFAGRGADGKGTMVGTV